MKKTEKMVLEYLKERGWDNLQPVDIAKSLIIECAELLELFQWDNQSLEEVKKNREKIEKIKKELADVLIYAFDMAVLLNIDTEKIVKEKLEHVKKKYPAELMKKSVNKDSKADDEYWRIKKEYRRKGMN